MRQVQENDFCHLLLLPGAGHYKSMTDSYTLVPDLLEEVSIPENGILSRTLQNDEKSKVVAFGFAEGQELSAHTAPMPAVLYVAKGEARLRLGDDETTARAGTLVHMPPRLEHGILAQTPVVMFLILLKQ